MLYRRPLSRWAVGLALGTLVLTATACSSSSSAPTTTTTTSATTPKDFQLSTPDGHVSISADGKLPSGWPTSFPVPKGTTVTGSGSIRGASNSTMVGVYSTTQSPSDAYQFYATSSVLTTSSHTSIGSGSSFLGSMSITAPSTGNITVTARNGSTTIVAVLTSTSSGG